MSEQIVGLVPPARQGSGALRHLPNIDGECTADRVLGSRLCLRGAWVRRPPSNVGVSGPTHSPDKQRCPAALHINEISPLQPLTPDDGGEGFLVMFCSPNRIGP